MRFLVVGVWNSAFSYALFALLLYTLGPSLQALESSSSSLIAWIGQHWYLAVQWVGWALAVPQSTLAFKYLCFHSKGHALGEIGRSYSVYLPTQIISSVLLWLSVRVLHLSPLLGQLIAVCTGAVIMYFGHKYWTFRQPKETVGSTAPEPPGQR